MLSTLVEIRKFLESDIRVVITIIFEDYLKNPTILKNVFDQAGISPYVLLKDYWGDGFTDWPTLNDMRRLGRLVVFNNNGLHGFPYTEFNMWRYVRENRYGTPSRKKRVCSRVKVLYQTNNSLNMQGKICTRVKWPTQAEFTPVSIARSDSEY